MYCYSYILKIKVYAKTIHNKINFSVFQILKNSET